jgi:maleylacetate reductase
VNSLSAQEGTRCLAEALPKVVDDPSDLEARSLALRGAWMCGLCLGSTTMSLHHKLCHVLGGTLDLPHAPTHAVIIAELAAAVHAPASLSALGVAVSDLATVIEQMWEQPSTKPRKANRRDLQAILDTALSGAPTEEVL